MDRTGLKALIIAEPWISLILAGKKRWEMRNRPWSHRGPIALIRKGSGKVVGVASLTEMGKPLEDSQLQETFHYHQVPFQRFFADGKARWRFPWVLEAATELSTPIPYQHPSGALISVNLEPAVAAAITAQLNPTVAKVNGGQAKGVAPQA